MSHEAKRILARADLDHGTLIWYFKSSEGTFGPYCSYDEALQQLRRFVSIQRNLEPDSGHPSFETRIQRAPRLGDLLTPLA